MVRFSNEKISVPTMTLIILFLFLIGLVIYLIMRVNAAEAASEAVKADNRRMNDTIERMKMQMYAPPPAPKRHMDAMSESSKSDSDSDW